MTKSFRDYLQQEFVRRSSRNPSYSLRAYAQQLGVNHASLSTMLSGKRKITADTIKKIAHGLQLDPHSVSNFVSQAENQTSGDSANSYYLLQQDAFSAMSEWYFDAILELTRIRNFKLEAKTIASALGIKPLQASVALEILERLELIVKGKKGRYELAHAASTNILDADFTNAAKKKYQKSILEKSLETIETVDAKDRDHTSMTMAIHREDMPAAKQMIRKFRRQFDTFVQRDGKRFDDVYQLQISFFPLTKLETN